MKILKKNDANKLESLSPKIIQQTCDKKKDEPKLNQETWVLQVHQEYCRKTKKVKDLKQFFERVEEESIEMEEVKDAKEVIQDIQKVFK